MIRIFPLKTLQTNSFVQHLAMAMPHGDGQNLCERFHAQVLFGWGLMLLF